MGIGAMMLPLTVIMYNDFCYTEEQAIKTEEILSKIAVGISKEQLWRQ